MKSFSKRNLSKAVLLAVIIVPTMLLFQSFLLKEKGKDLKIGKKFPMASTNLEGIDGANYNLNKLAGENGLVVIFSCNTCPFVVGNDNFEGWEKQYNEIHETAQKNKMGVVLINSNEAKRTLLIKTLRWQMLLGQKQLRTLLYLIKTKNWFIKDLLITPGTVKKLN